MNLDTDTRMFLKLFKGILKKFTVSNETLVLNGESITENNLRLSTFPRKDLELQYKVSLVRKEGWINKDHWGKDKVVEQQITRLLERFKGTCIIKFFIEYSKDKNRCYITFELGNKLN